MTSKTGTGRAEDASPTGRLVKCGPGSLTTAELLSLLVRHGCRASTALDIGCDLLAQFGLRGLARATARELESVLGCGPAKSVQVKAAIELGRRLAQGEQDDQPRITSPQDAADLLAADMADLEQEHLRVLLLSTKNDLVAVHEVYRGSVSCSQVRIAELFRDAIRSNCPAILIAHNHPSGDPLPSAEDIHVTRQVVEAGRLLDIDVLDHIIIGRRSWVSLRERGLGFG